MTDSRTAQSIIGTRYGRHALDALRAVVSEAKRDDPMAPVTVLVPNNVAGIVARRYLARGLTDRGPGIAGIAVTTLPRLAEQLAAAALHPRRPATTPVVAAAWRRALETEGGVFARVKDHPATIRALSAAHRELRDVSPTGRDAARAATTLSRDLLRLHEAVVDRLAPDWYDVTDLLHVATRLATERPEQLVELGTVVLHLPQPMSRAEVGFARAVADSRGITVVVGLTGVDRADDPVRGTLADLGLTVDVDKPEPPTATRVLHASDADDEVRCVVRAVVEALETTPAHRIAVLYGSAQPYARQLQEQFASAGLAVNGPATRAVHERAVARGFLDILGLAAANLPRASTFAALAEAPVRAFTDDRVPVARWERISRLAGIAGGDWGAKLATYVADLRSGLADLQPPEDHDGRIAALERAIADAEAMSRFVTELGRRLAEGEACRTWADLSHWASNLFHDLYGDASELRGLPPEEQYAAVVVEQSLLGLAALATFEERADLTLLREVLGLDLESALPRVGRFGEGVFVGPVSAAVGMDLDRVFVLGLSEDGFPGRLHEDALLNDTVRSATAGELEPVRAVLDIKHRHMLAAFTAAPDVTASFPRGDLRKSTQRLPSRFLLPSLRTITGNKELAATAWDDAHQHRQSTDGRLVTGASYAHGVLHGASPASDQEWQVRATAAGVPLPSPAAELAAAARDLIDARESNAFSRFDGNLSHVDGLPDHARSGRPVSPTALEAYAKCPHGYFVRRMLGVEPLEQPEEVLQISAADIGTLIHEAMDAMITEAGRMGTLPSYGEPWLPAHRQRLQEHARRKAAEMAERGLTGHRRLWEPELAAILVVLDRMLDDDDDWRRDLDARVVSSELAFGLPVEGSGDPVRIPLGEGTVLMRGSADKIDLTRDGGLLVTDIKSGKAKLFEVLDEDPVAAGTKLQLPVYAHAARRAVEATGEQVTSVAAMYWFVRRDAGTRIAVILDDALEAQYAAALDTLVTGIAHGLYPNRPSPDEPYGFIDCWACTPDGIGHKAARARYERKRRDPALAGLMSLIDPSPPAELIETQDSDR